LRVTAAPFAPENRAVFAYDRYDPNDSLCSSAIGSPFGNCRASKGHVLDSFINMPGYGDERYFLRARLDNQPATESIDPLIDIVPGSTVALRVYVDNDTAVNPGDPGRSDLHDTRVRVNLTPSSSIDQLFSSEWVLQPRAFITASNVRDIEDGVNLEGPRPFGLEYVPGSAYLVREDNRYPLSSGIVGHKGALIGLLNMNGDLPPGQFGATVFVELEARVVAAKATPAVRVLDRVRRMTAEGWNSVAYAKPGNVVEWLLNTTNVSRALLHNVITRDELPSNLRFVPGSIKFTNARGSEPLADTPNGGPLFGGGYNAGSYNSKDNTLITFDTEVLGNFNGCQTIDRTQASARWNQQPKEVISDADVVITQPPCPT
jgi:uncharacterized repeat protein (TIGR01451 family)